MKTAGIYIHIPFCKNKCIYCDYYSLEKRESLEEAVTSREAILQSQICTQITVFMSDYVYMSDKSDILIF